MKKLIVILAVLALAMPSMAAVTLTGTATGLTATIGYSWDGAGSRPRAFALRIAASTGNITAVGKIKTADGVSTAASPGYGIYPGSINIDSAGVVTTYGTPVEPATLPGASGTGLNTSSVVVALGSLYVGDANKPLNAANLLTVTCSTACTLTVTQETTNRGGVVGEDAATIAATPASLLITVPGAVVDGCVKTTAPFYADWVAFGKPSCWCYLRHCKGDADGLKQGNSVTGYTYVYTNDLTILSNAYNIKEPPKGSGIMAKYAAGVCADFDHLKQGNSVTGYTRVYTNDLTALSNAYNKKEPPKGSGIGTCADAVNFNTQY